eukprot:jgi/Bigna1/74774/fgenesh1_pg.31_\
MSSSSSSSGGSECVKVVVRCRPLNSKEKQSRERTIVELDTELKQVYVTKPDDGEQRPKTFTFDSVFPPSSTQEMVWELSAKHIVDSVLEGYNGTIFAYGQTGTGKTFTMEGVVDDEKLRGIMPHAFHHIMEAVEGAASNTEFLVRVSFLEIYNDQVYDLLAKTRQRMEVREKTDRMGNKEVFVKDLKQFVVKSVREMMNLLHKGQKIRKVGATGMNAGSSRSHSIFTINVESCETTEDGKKMFKVGKLNMVDLAGSERQKKTGATGERLAEGNSINASLSALGNVIKALVSKRAKHIPFRDSRLTRLLQNSLGGNTKTVMFLSHDSKDANVANLGPAASNFEETMSTLRYASRAKSIKNKPRVNEDPKDAMLKKCQDEIEALRRQLEAAKAGGGGGLSTGHSGGGQGAVGSSHDLEVEEKTVIKEEGAQKLQKEMGAKGKAIDEEKAPLEAIQRKLNQKTPLLMKGAMITEVRIKSQLEKAKEKELLLEEQYANRQDELKSKTEKLKELYNRYKEKQSDLKDLQDEWEVERVDLVDDIRKLDQKLRLRDLILRHYVPDRWLKKIEDRAHYNEPTDEWVIPGLHYAANNIDHEERKEMRRKANSTYARNLMMRGRRQFGPFDPMREGEEPQVEELQGPPPKQNPYYSYGVDVRKKRNKRKTKTKKRRN